MNEQVQTGIVNISGKEYTTVAKRISDFRLNPRFADWQVLTEIIHMGDEAVVFKCTIYNFEGRPMATGHAEEFRTSSKINRTSATENCETSAIGRALAALGIGGTSFASAEEVERAIEQQKPITSLQVKVLESLMEDGHIKPEHLQKVFGTDKISELYAVEADRIINKFEGVAMPPADETPTKDEGETE